MAGFSIFLSRTATGRYLDGGYMKKWAFVCIFLLLVSGVLHGKFHPEIKWREIKSGKFHVVYPLGYESEAGYTLEKAQSLYTKLSDFWQMEVEGKIKILLTDTYDMSNGLAAFFPYNYIQIYLIPPMPDDTLSGAGEWLSLVLTHEMTHIFNMNAGSGFFKFMRDIFGSNPVFYPLAAAPVWLIEGLPVYAESKYNPGGRLNTPDYNLMLSAIVAGKKMPRLSRVHGDPTHWPGPRSRYFYGSAFSRFLAQKYGEDKLARLVARLGRYVIPPAYIAGSENMPLTLARTFQKVYGRDLKLLWIEFELNNLANYDEIRTGDITPLTLGGFGKQYPVVVDDHTIFYYSANYREYPGIYRFDPSDGTGRRWVTRSGVNGMTYHPGRKKIYFSAIDIYKSYYHYSDIYEMDIRTRDVRRVTRGARLFHPSPAGDQLVAVKRVNGGYKLVRVDPVSGRESSIPGHHHASGVYRGLAFPAVSPDGRYIAFSVKGHDGDIDGNWRIGLSDREKNSIQLLTPPGLKAYYPVWKNEKEFYFIQQQDDNYFPARYTLDSPVVTVYGSDNWPGVRYISFSSPSSGLSPFSGKSVVVYYNADGFDLGEVRLEELPSHSQDVPVPGPEGTLPGISSPPKIRHYPFLRDLLPKYFTFSYRDGGNEHQPGIYMSGFDMLEEHSFTLEGYYGVESQRFNWDFSYSYDGMHPTLTVHLRDLTDLNRDSDGVEFTFREQLAEFIGMFPLVRRNRLQSYLYTDIYFQRESTQLLNTGTRESVDLNGVKVGILINTARRYFDALSLSDGFRLAVSYARDIPLLGSDYEINTAAVEFKNYLSFFRPGVLAVRLTLADSWGEARRLMYMGGADSYPGYSVAGNSVFKLMRGYPSGYFSGTGGYLCNIEFRVPLFKVERPFLWIRSIQRVYLNLYADIGNMWKKEWDFDPSYSFGAELAVPVLAGDFQFTLTGGVAFGVNPTHNATWYFRLGNSF